MKASIQKEIQKHVYIGRYGLLMSNSLQIFKEFGGRKIIF